ncbi:MAG: ion transporter [Opitutae bacterium]
MSGKVSWQARFESARSNRLFELFIILVIIASALLIGVKTYQLPSWVKPLLDGLDLLITLIFLVEISIRFLGEPQKRAFFRTGWNVFDTLIVFISLIPIDDTDSALVARLVRVFRVLRMVSIVPELRLLLNSIISALPRLGYVAALIFIIFYIYAAAGSLFFDRINPELWGNISIAMLTLFRVMTFEDWTDVMYETMDVYSWSWIFYLTFIFLTTFAFLNMVIGIVVSVLDEEQSKLDTEDPNRTSLANLKDELTEIKTSLRAIERRLDGDENSPDRSSSPPSSENR